MRWWVRSVLITAQNHPPGDRLCHLALRTTRCVARPGISPLRDKLFASDLLKSGGEIPDGHYEEESMKRTVVPFRNGIMLAIACGIAESRNAESLVIAAHSGDHAIYPDCRESFMQAMAGAMREGAVLRGSNCSVPSSTTTKLRLPARGMSWASTSPTRGRATKAAMSTAGPAALASSAAKPSSTLASSILRSTRARRACRPSPELSASRSNRAALQSADHPAFDARSPHSARRLRGSPASASGTPPREAP